jgi:polyisoprenoid-binding protein YceI
MRLHLSRALPAIAAVMMAPPSAFAADRLQAGPQDGRIVVNVFKAGLFSAFAHDHHFVVTDWKASAGVPERGPGAASIDVVLSASSLRDTQAALSEADRRKVDAQAAGAEGLDAAHHPRIEFRSDGIELAPPTRPELPARGTAHGTLTVRDHHVPVDVPFEANHGPDGWRVRGTARLKQSAVGIRPFSGFGGTVKVKDEVTIEFSFTLRGPRS